LFVKLTINLKKKYLFCTGW